MNKKHWFSIASVIFSALIVAGSLFAQTSDPSAEKFPYLGEVTEDNINVRAGQSENFENLAQLKKGEDIVVVDRSYSWYKIRLPIHAHSYISADFVNMLSDDVGEMTGNNINVRAGKGINYSVLGQLAKGSLVRVVEKSDGWYRIDPINNSWGWILAKYVKFKSPKVPSERVVFAPTKNIYKQKQLVPEDKSLESSPQKMAEERRETVIAAVGVVTAIEGGKPIDRDIRHQIVVDGQPKYYLKAYRTIIDSFLRQQVKIEGKPLPQIEAEYPVLLVTKIQLVL